MVNLAARQLLNLLPSWVKTDPRRLSLFLHLLENMDEEGYAEFSLREYSRSVGQPHTTIHRILQNMEKWNIIETIVEQKRTIVYICNPERYNPKVEQWWNNSGTIAEQSFTSQKEENEKNGSPQTPFIEKKDKKENAISEVASLKKERNKAPEAQISFIPREPMEVRREHFWADIVDCWHRHREWPAEGVRSFFLFWSEPTLDGRLMKFELGRTFGISHRMGSYLKRGRWLTEFYEDKIATSRERRQERSLRRRQADAARQQRQEGEQRQREREERARRAATPEQVAAIVAQSAFLRQLGQGTPPEVES